MNKTGETLPNNFFFLLASFGTFCYLKTNKAELKRLVSLGDGRTKKMYEFLAPIVEFEYKHFSFKKFQQALKKAKEEIDAGYPVVLGALDMYYLPYYEKLYHKEHIPFHYVLMVGYDEDEKKIYLYDCGRPDLLSLSYDELGNCMNCSYSGLSKENTICIVRLHSSKSKYQIAIEALAKKKEMFLNPPTGFLGYKGFEKFIKELSQWKNEMENDDYNKILANMVMFFGTVPTIPNALKGIDEPDDIEFKGGFDKMSHMLRTMGTQYNNNSWIEVSKLFEESANTVQKISHIIISYLSHIDDETGRLPSLFSEILKNLKAGYSMLDVS